MSKFQALLTPGRAGPPDDLKVLAVLTEPMTLPVLERRLGQAGHRIDPQRLRTLLAELHAGRFIQTTSLGAQAVYTRTALGARLCLPRATSPPEDGRPEPMPFPSMPRSPDDPSDL